MQTYISCLSQAPVENRIFLKLFRILFCLFLWIFESYEQKYDVSANNNNKAQEGTPLMTTTKQQQLQDANNNDFENILVYQQ